MKTVIHKINQYLLENYPTIWNTRLVWMLSTALLLHLVFFVFGVFTLSNPEMLHDRYVGMIFFENGTVFLSSIISILLIVGWLIYMFKNNAFKSFYPTTQLKLFAQFMCYVLIVFSCTTFYLSYNYGIKTYIASRYPDAEINKQIEIANDVALFFSESVSDYTIDKRRYPKPFYDLYCETQEKFIDKDKAHVTFLDEAFQFYTLSTKELPISRDQYPKTYEDPNDSTFNGYVFSKNKDSLRIYYYKDSVIDIKPLVKTIKPSYYNASSTFYISLNDTLINNYSNYYYNYEYYPEDSEYNYNHKPEFSLRHQLRNQRNIALLDRNDKSEIKALLDAFLKFSDDYNIDHNLTADQWLNMVYQPETFEVKHFIRTIPKGEFEYSEVVSLEKTQFQQYYSDHVSDAHYQHDILHNVLENIEDIKASNPFLESIHFFLWLAFFFACIVFMFRVTGLKPLLFSIITVGLLTLFLTLITATVFFFVINSDNEAFYFMSYLTLSIGTIILLIPIVFIERIKKIVVAICVNISIIGFPLYIFLILGIITMHQTDICRADIDYFKNYYQCDTILSSLEVNWSYVLFFIGIIFIFLYCKVIKQWKSLPEG